MRTEKEIRKMIEKATRHPERFHTAGGPDARSTIEVLKWVLEEEAEEQDIAPLQDEDAEHHQYLEREEELEELDRRPDG